MIVKNKILISLNYLFNDLLFTINYRDLTVGNILVVKYIFLQIIIDLFNHLSLGHHDTYFLIIMTTLHIILNLSIF